MRLESQKANYNMDNSWLIFPQNDIALSSHPTYTLKTMVWGQSFWVWSVFF